MPEDPHRKEDGLMSLECKRYRRLELNEEEARRRHLEQLDRHILERIERRLGEYIPRERLERVREHKARFLKHEEYLEHLRREYNYRPTEGERVLGDCRGEGICQITIDREHPLVPKTLAHERLHQLCDARFREFFGHPLHEGLTEYLARKISPDLQIRDLGESYPKERRLVEMLFARAGDDALQRAYFQGDWRLLQQRVERDLGEGALEKVIQAAKQENYEEAERLLQGF
jgi:hypothetical protein